MTRPSGSQLLAALEAKVINIETHIPRVIITLYGDPGSGKTVLAHQIAQVITPPDRKIVTVDTSGAIIALKKHSELAHRVVPIQYENLTQLAAIAGAIQSSVGSFANIGTLVLDEYSSIADSSILAVGAGREAFKAAKNTPVDALNKDALEQRDYGIARNQLARLMSETNGLRSIKHLNIIMTAHARSDKDGADIPVTSMEFPAKIKLDVAKMSQLIGYCYADTVKVGGKDVIQRKVVVNDSYRIKAKNQLGGLNAPTVTGQQVVEAITNFLGSSTQITENKLELESAENV